MMMMVLSCEWCICKVQPNSHRLHHNAKKKTTAVASHRRLDLTAHVDVAGPHPPVGPARHSGTQSAGFRKELLAGLSELPDPPAVDDGIKDRLQVTEPQGPSADRVEDGAVVEPPAEHGQQADHGVGQPADREADKQDEDGGEGPSLEAHVNPDLRRALEARQSHFADLVERWQAGLLAVVVVDPQGVAAYRVENAHVRVEHDSEWYKEDRHCQQHCVPSVCHRVGVSQHTLWRPGAPVSCRALPPADDRRQRHAQAQDP